jgi:hypothetical protein
MLKLSQAIAQVMAGTMASGVAGGVVGAAVGRLAPTFVRWLYSPGVNAAPRDFDPTEFGFGLGVVSGLLLGSVACVFLAVVLALRDAYLVGKGANPASPVEV